MVVTNIAIVIIFFYIVSIGYVIVGWIKTPKNHNSSIKSSKQISVVIAYRNEFSTIIKCIKSFENQTISKASFELILVNDHSTDNSSVLVKNYSKTSKLSILCIDLVNKTSKKEALTLGIQNAAHPIIACTDADCLVPENWLENIASSFENKITMLIGPVAFEDDFNFISYFQVLDMLALQGITFGMLKHKKPILNNGANIAFSKSAFNLVGGYDQHKTPSGDDVFLLEKLYNENLPIAGLLDKNHIVITQFQSTWQSFIQQRLRWASKSTYYSNLNLIYFSSIVYFTNVLQIFIYMGVVLVDNYTVIGIILLFSKWLIDFILLHLTAKFFSKKIKLVDFVIMQLIYPLYIVFIGLISVLGSFNWKDRNYK